MTSHLRKRNKTLTNEQEQYKEALCTLNKEVKELTDKLKEGVKREKEQQAKEALEKELTALLGLVEMAKVDAVNNSRLHSLSLTSVLSTMVTGLRIS